jgi:hypothetical protein
MINNHPIQISTKESIHLIEKWEQEWRNNCEHISVAYSLRVFLANKAAQWGADQELKACEEYLISKDESCFALQMHANRRPKQMSAKEQAFKALDAIEGDFNTVGDRVAIIRKALEFLPDEN